MPALAYRNHGSKPVFAVATTGLSWLALGPASTRQDVTRVAPFQLAYTLAEPPERRTAALGGLSGWPTKAVGLILTAR